MEEVQSSELEIRSSLEEIRQLNDYGFSILDQIEKKTDSRSIGKDLFLLGLFVSALAQIQGIICLVENHRYRVSTSQVRTLLEIWVTVKFIYCTRTRVYLWFMIIMSEKDRLDTLKMFYEEGQITEKEYGDYCRVFNKRLSVFKKKYPVWPEDIPPVINSKKDTLLQLKEKKGSTYFNAV